MTGNVREKSRRITPTSVVDRLRVEILTGRFAPGEHLVELRLSEQLGEPRGSIRSALIELEKEGLVEREANRGATVRRMSLAEAIQITEARSALECLVASRAARHATNVDVVKLQKIVAEMQDAVGDSHPMRYSELNGALHERIREMSDHQVANELVRNLRDRSARLQLHLALVPGRPQESLLQHQAIVDAIVAHDEDAAAAAMQIHLDSAIDALRHWADLYMPI